ncbi:MAG: LysM peptidoglycan-binding domain-containing protein [Thiohalomonadaceae bacterium]
MTRIHNICFLALATALSLSGCAMQQARPDTTPEEEATTTVAVVLEAGVAVEPTDTSTAEDLSAGTPVEPAVVQEAAVETGSDIWERIRRGMTLEGRDHPGIARDLEWFARHQAYLDRVADRAQPYMHLIVEEVEKRGMPSELALLPVVESAFQPFAYSHGRAAGIWQFVPGTGRRFGLKQTWWYDGRRDIARSTRAALDYLQFLNKEFQGDWLLALAAYNSGEGTVLRAQRNNRRKGKGTDFWSLDLPRETRGYVPKLLAISAIVADPAAHGIALKPIADEPYLAAVDVGSQIDLDLAAELAGISLDDMYRYNPAFNRWATDPDGPHTLLVPVANAETFQTRLAELPAAERIQWVRHRIRNGDTLGTIASRYRTTVALIKSVNGIRGNTIRAGNSLVIPVARKDLARYSLSAEQRLASIQETRRKGERIEYVVQEGDSLWSIAQAHGVSVQQLAQWNGMAPRDPLLPGRSLVIWGQPAQEEEQGGISRVSLTPGDFKHPHSDSLRQRIGYTVRNGDSLAGISRKFQVSVADLKRWNRLSDTLLRPGQRLTVYVDVTRQSGNI